jgi:uncharacterized BrkB/YihY/UPF0761 family membrane protein
MADTFNSFVWGYLSLWIILFGAMAYAIWKIQRLEKKLNSSDENQRSS